ncbi:ABC transporter substrate-binding protein [Pelagicoccus albus]|uniref:ABC transporter substrate-binding protein n=1 Tax=Pelagicoccus albus TaxID=415222 RepID=A0A7X1EA31_9BACT|nr:ABC transporter substrate-binding protein [Pelagicoccus albus]MBC2607941.1 ABC transporter substrate-binding protein [Pelagicoccus albus]
MDRSRVTTTVATLLAALTLFACRASKEKTNDKEASTTNRLEFSEEESHQKLKDAFSWDRYVSNDYLPIQGETDFSNFKSATGPTKKLRVALPWLVNDQVPALWFGLARGYFEQEGLDIEVVPGGPGRDNLILLLSNQVDIAIASSTTSVIRMLASDTGGEVVAVGALQKEYPYAYIAIDQTIPQSQTSQRELTAEDFRGKKLGMTPGGEIFLSFALEKLGLESSDIVVSKAGTSLVPLTNGVYDYYTTMADNNPRKLEAMGYQNWMLWEFRKHGWEDYHNVVTVLPSTLQNDAESVRAFLRGLDHSLRELLAADSLSAAKEIHPLIEESGLTAELIARRLDLQRPLSLAKPNEDLLFMTEDRWVEAAAILWRHGAIDLPDQTSSPE